MLRTASGAIGATISRHLSHRRFDGSLGADPLSTARTRSDGPSAGAEPRPLDGTDILGRDVASRIIEGGTNSLIVVSLSVLIATIVGTSIGVIAAYYGGLTDNLAMRVMDVFFAFPAILLALLVVTVLGAGMRTTVLAIALVYTPIFSRVARAPVLALKRTEFVEAANSIGLQRWRILLRHILPNAIAPIIVQISLALSWALLTEAGLSFLGLGTPPPEPSWGQMLSDSTGIAEIAPWLLIFPAAAIMLSVLGFNLLGDSLRDALDPRLRGIR